MKPWPILCPRLRSLNFVAPRRFARPRFAPALLTDVIVFHRSCAVTKENAHVQSEISARSFVRPLVKTDVRIGVMVTDGVLLM